jgi:hypothetical protein
MQKEEEREFIRNFLNDENSIQELALRFNLKKCAICDNWEFEEDLTDTTGFLNGGIGYICENCINDF